ETNIAAELVAIYTALSNKAPGGYGFGDKLQEIAATSAEETYETYCTKVDAVLSGMPDRTAKLVRAYPPTTFHQAGTTVSLLYKGDANYAVLSNIGSADAGLCGWRMIKLRYPSSSSPSVWMPFEWESPLCSSESNTAPLIATTVSRSMQKQLVSAKHQTPRPRIYLTG
ncbi:MAG: hypothetical protein ACLRLX_06340, partial [Anaerovoracaceae bacterium]